MVALVYGDLGMNASQTQRAIADLPADVTLSVGWRSTAEVHPEMQAAQGSMAMEEEPVLPSPAQATGFAASNDRGLVERQWDVGGMLADVGGMVQWNAFNGMRSWNVGDVGVVGGNI